MNWFAFLSGAAQETTEAMGWDENSIICHLSGFIHSRKLTAEWEQYLADMAAEEQDANT